MKYVKLSIYLACILALSSGCTMVGPGERGIRTVFGKASPDSLNPGLHLWIPFLFGSDKMDVRLQKHEVTTNAASKDMQTVVTKFALNWRIDPEKVSEVYQRLGDEDAVLTNVIDPAISEVLKAATAKKNVEEILAKREDLKKDIDVLMKERMLAKDIIVEDINIVDVQFSTEFAAAIEAKQVAEQHAKKASYDAQKAEQEAVAEVNRAKGQSQAQNLLKMTLTKELLQLKAIEKWDGKYPQYVGGNAMPMISLGDK